MKKIFLTLILFVFYFVSQGTAFAEDDWDILYNESKPFEMKLMNNLDPFQDEDNVKYTYSPYPLFRTSCYLYYKGQSIPSGYYQLTPRKMNGNYYIFFKTNGRVAFIIPVVKRELIASVFYKKYMPEPKRTLGQTVSHNWIHFWGNVFKDSGRQDPPKSFIELMDAETYFVLKFYHAEHCYISVFKKVPY